MTDRPSAPQPVAGVVLDRDGLPALVVRGNEGYHVAHAGASRVYSQAALDAAVAAARAEERERWFADVKQVYKFAHEIFNDPPSETPQAVRDVIEWHHEVMRLNLDAAAIRAATPQEPTAVMARLETAEASERDKWQTAVFTLMGHAAGLYAEGKHDMPAWCYELAETIARTHLDEAHAQRVRQVAVQQRAMYGEPT